MHGAPAGCRQAWCVAAPAAAVARQRPRSAALTATLQLQSGCRAFVGGRRCCSAHTCSGSQEGAILGTCCSSSAAHSESATAAVPTLETAALDALHRHRQQQAEAAQECAVSVQQLPTASLSRSFYSVAVQPARIARTATGGGSGRGGHSFSLPSSLLVLAVTVTTAVVAAVRARVRSVRDCPACRGFGIKRCKLCVGRGAIEWEGKMAHREPCPLCLGRRLTRCACCGGTPLLGRHLFRHKHSGGEAGLITQLQSLKESAQRQQWPLMQRLAGKGGAESDAERKERSDQLAEQIMMD